MISHIERDASTVKKKRGLIKHFVTESLDAELVASVTFLCADERIFQVVCPHIREREEGRKEGMEERREGGREGTLL